MSDKEDKLLLKWAAKNDKEKIAEIEELRKAIILSTIPDLIINEKDWVSPKLMLRILFQALAEETDEVRITAAMAIADIVETNPIHVSRIYG